MRIGVFPFGSTLCLHGDVFVARGIEVPSVHLLVHEFGHVWEWQHGQWQVTLGAVEQLRHLLGTNVYDYGGPAGLRAAVEAGRTLESFNREQQAEIFADDWAAKRAARDDRYAHDLATLTAPALRRIRAGW